MATEKFRQQLSQEVEQWQAEGLIDDALAQTLAERYQFSELAAAHSNRFIMFMMGLGSILLGLAAITFVAANWQAWSKEIKTFLLIGLWLGVNVAGVYLWQDGRSAGRSRLGHGLLLMGTLLLGATLGFIAQMFHSSGESFILFLLWGLGTLAMAFALRLTSLGIASWVVLEVGYWGGIADRLFVQGSLSPLMGIVRHFPLVTILLWIPLAYTCRSRWLFGLAAVGATVAFGVNTAIFLEPFYNRSALSAGTVAALGLTLPTLLFWAYQDRLWVFLPEEPSFIPHARRLSVATLSCNLYALSFNIWGDRLTFQPLLQYPAARDWLNLADIVVLLGFALWAWRRLGAGGDRGWQIDAVSTGVAALAIASGSLVWVYFVWGGNPILFTVLFNGLLIALSMGCIWQAMNQGQRLGFWWGVLAIVLQLFARMIEYDTGLLLKAAILFLCGITVIAAGLWFERYLRSLRSPMEGSWREGS